MALSGTGQKGLFGYQLKNQQQAMIALVITGVGLILLIYAIIKM